MVVCVEGSNEVVYVNGATLSGHWPTEDLNSRAPGLISKRVCNEVVYVGDRGNLASTLQNITYMIHNKTT